MSKKYLLRFTPLEPYFLGGENTFRVDERNKYYASSLLIPTASTIIGTLRFTLLELAGVLNTDGKYTAEEKRICDLLIGAGSYSVGRPNSFGKIKSISPVFLSDGKDIYIKTPQNCKASCVGDHYMAIELSQERYCTSFENPIRLPLPGEYSVKSTVSEESYMRLFDGKIVTDLFSWVERVGIAKAKSDKAFFKKRYVSLKKGFSFAVVADLEDDVPLRETFCHMGREKAAFLLSAEETDIDIDLEIQTALSSRTNTAFNYAFGDTFVFENQTFSDFAMLQTVYVRMLRSRVEGDALKVTCANDFYQLMRAGSVFYADDIQSGAETNYGYNRIIKIEV